MGYLHRGSLILVNRLDAEALNKRLNRKTGTFLGVIIGVEIERFWLNSSGVGFGVYRFIKIVIAIRV